MQQIAQHETQGREDKRPGQVGPQQTVRNDMKKIGRNDPCPCGSGKKFKNCGLKNTQEHIKNTK
jgi:preprotein translocase subunit SecA